MRVWWPAARPIYKRRIECRNRNLEAVLDQAELHGGREVDYAPPDDKRIQQGIDRL